MVQNAYFLENSRFDTAENVPAKKIANFCTKIAKFANFAIVEVVAHLRGEGDGAADHEVERAEPAG